MNKKQLFDEIINAIKTIEIMDSRSDRYEIYDKTDRLLDDFRRRAYKISPKDREIYIKEINEVQANFKEYNEEFFKRCLKLEDEFEVFFFRKFLGYRFKYGKSFDGQINDVRRVREISESIFMNAGLLGKLKRIMTDSTPLPKQDETPPQQPKTDHSALMTALSKHLTINPEEFKNIIEKHKLTGTQKGEWIGKPSDAYRFIDHIGMERPQFNLCFSIKDYEKLETNHRQVNRETKKPTRSAINKILEKYIPK